MNKPLLMKRLIFALALLLALQSLGASRAIAQPALPSSFYGTVKYEGQNVPVGTPITAYIENVRYAITYARLEGLDTVFQINIGADNPDTLIEETAEAVEGKLIEFRVNNNVIDDINPIWHTGTNVMLDLAYYDNRVPVAKDKIVIVTPPSPVTFTLEASDEDGDTLTYQYSNPSQGSLTGTPPILTYTPNLSFISPDSFKFKVSDGEEESNEATVTLRTNVAPVLIPYSFIIDEDTPLLLDLADFAVDSDGDDLTWEILTPPINGSVDSVTLTYTPLNDFPFREDVGYDSFTIQVNDGFADSNVVTISITVNEVDDPPVAPDMNIIVFQNTPKNIQLAGVDVDSSYAKWFIETDPNHGVLTQPFTDITRTRYYYPDKDYLGQDSFQYYLETTDEILNQKSNIGTVNIKVEVPACQIFLPLILK